MEKVTKNERLTELRKCLGLTMEAFGEKIGLSRQSISNIESGRRSVTSRMIMAISREFNVSEDWLENGNGEMFKPITSEDELLDYAKRLGIGDSFRKRLVGALFRLNDEELARAEQFVNDLARIQIESINKEAEAQLSDEDRADIDRMVEDYRNQLIAEKVAEEKLSVSQDPSWSDAKEA